MMSRTTIDRAGRIVIPKPLRDAAGLEPGDELDISAQDGIVTIRPVQSGSPMSKEAGIWVYRSGVPACDEDILRLVASARDERTKQMLP